jgi:hypothetical protein
VLKTVSLNSRPDPDADLQALTARLESLELTNAECFLCANPITDGRYTREHVIPAWAQRRYNLWNQRLQLLNGTEIPYRQLTVPCCDDCNRNKLRPLEDSLSQTVEAGYKAVNALSPKVLLLWLQKIFFGILYKELFLLLDRSSADGHTIITPEFIRYCGTLRLFLQQAREKVRLVDFTPGSIFVFPMQPLPRKELEWDFCDNVGTQFFGCRVGKVALFALLGDGGALQYFEDEYNDIKDMPLHPIQFLELCAQFSYRSTLATRTPKYFTLEGMPHRVLQMHLGGYSLKPLFDDGDPRTYAKFLSYSTELPFENLFQPPNRVKTWLRKPTGEPYYMSVTDFPPGTY